MLSGAPASGKGTQCELIVQKVTKFMHNLLQFNILLVVSMKICVMFYSRLYSMVF